VLVILTTRDERALEAAADETQRRGASVVRFFEPDLDNSLTSFACFVDDASARYLRRLQLLHATPPSVPTSDEGGEI
jgi:hypothetical protein